MYIVTCHKSSCVYCPIFYSNLPFNILDSISYAVHFHNNIIKLVSSPMSTYFAIDPIAGPFNFSCTVFHLSVKSLEIQTSSDLFRRIVKRFRRTGYNVRHYTADCMPSFQPNHG